MASRYAKSAEGRSAEEMVAEITVDGGDGTAPGDVRELGTGTRGTVYEVHRHQQPLAVKVLRPGVGVRRDVLDRFLQGSANRLRHPNLQTLLSVEENDRGEVLYTTAVLRGDSLEKLLEDLRRGQSDHPSLHPLAVGPAGELHPEFQRYAVELCAEVAEGLAVTHAAGIVHGRITPRNLILNPGGRLVLTDFGAPPESTPGKERAERGRERSTAPSDVLLKRYRAPELSAREALPTAASDVYALGLILFELIEKRAADVLAWLAGLHEETAVERQGAAALPAVLPTGLTAAIRKATAPDPALRYANAGEFARDLQFFLRSEVPPPDAAAAPATETRTKPWSRRTRFAVAAVGFVLSLGLAFWAGQQSASDSVQVVTKSIAPPAATTLGDDRSTTTLVGPTSTAVESKGEPSKKTAEAPLVANVAALPAVEAPAKVETASPNAAAAIPPAGTGIPLAGAGSTELSAGLVQVVPVSLAIGEKNEAPSLVPALAHVDPGPLAGLIDRSGLLYPNGGRNPLEDSPEVSAPVTDTQVTPVPTEDSLVEVLTAQEQIRSAAESGELDELFENINVGAGLPPRSLSATDFHLLKETVVGIATTTPPQPDSETARAILCAWNLEVCEQLDASGAETYSAPPNLVIDLAGTAGKPDGPAFTMQWIRHQRALDPEGLLKEVGRLSRNEKLLLPLLETLGSLASDEQSSAASGARKNEGAQVIEAIVRLTREHHNEVGSEGLQLLSRLQRSDPLVEFAIGNYPLAFQLEALEQLRVGFAGQYFPRLRTLVLASPEAEIRRRGFEVLEHSTAPEAAKILPQTLDDAELAEASLDWLARLPADSAVELSVRLLSHSSAPARQLAVQILSETCRPEVVHRLVPILFGTYPEARQAAWTVLQAQGDSECLQRTLETGVHRLRQATENAGHSAEERIRQVLQRVLPRSHRVPPTKSVRAVPPPPIRLRTSSERTDFPVWSFGGASVSSAGFVPQLFPLTEVTSSQSAVDWLWAADHARWQPFEDSFFHK